MTLSPSPSLLLLLLLPRAPSLPISRSKALAKKQLAGGIPERCILYLSGGIHFSLAGRYEQGEEGCVKITLDSAQHSLFCFCVCACASLPSGHGHQRGEGSLALLPSQTPPTPTPALMPQIISVPDADYTLHLLTQKIRNKIIPVSMVSK